MATEQSSGTASKPKHHRGKFFIKWINSVQNFNAVHGKNIKYCINPNSY